MMLGAYRVDGDLKWRTSNTAATFNGWWSDEPTSTAGYDCIVSTQWHRWKTVPCSTTVTSVGCELDTWNFYNTTNTRSSSTCAYSCQGVHVCFRKSLLV